MLAKTALRRVLVRPVSVATLLLATASMSVGMATRALATDVSGNDCKVPYQPTIDPADFETAGKDPIPITNHYMPVPPQTTFVYDGTKDGLPQHDEVFVTDKRKTIMGVSTTVVQDSVTVAGDLVELTLDWFAQDKSGNVWYFGEDSTEFANGKVVGKEGSWQAGRNGALPGIVMEADPNGGDSYRQEYAPGIAEDMASVLSRSRQVTTPYGSFDNVLLTKETSCIEAGADHKFYAPGIGLVQAIAVSNGREQMQLTAIRHTS